MFYSNTTLQNIEKIEKLYYYSAIISTKAYKNTSREKLLQEINWESFTERCEFLGISMFAKIKLTKIPKIIYEQFPFSTTLRYSDRYKNNLKQLISKRNYFYNSYFVKMFRDWNKLPEDLKAENNYEDFKVKLIANRKEIIINHYNYDTETDRIYLSFRMKNSLLQSDKYKMGMSETNICINCPTKKQETLLHYVFHCPKYNYQRQKMLRQIKSIAKLKYISENNLLKLLMNNNINIYLHKNEYNFIILQFKSYIENTKRFLWLPSNSYITVIVIIECVRGSWVDERICII